MESGGESEAVANAIFDLIANDLQTKGYSVQPNALPDALVTALYEQCCALGEHEFANAGIGRGPHELINERVRRDEICWITPKMPAGQAWLAWAEALMSALNRRLFLGLFSVESHFAHYSPGDFYARHLDAFQGRSNRRLSMVTYLNRAWPESAGGELMLYQSDCDKVGLKIRPEWGKVVLFLSDEFPHEVLPAAQDRYSIASWFSINTSTEGRVDPPV